MTKPFVFWGKSEGEGQGLGYLSVWEHSLNVAAVADAWMEKRPSLWRRWTGLLGLSMDRKSLSAARSIALHFILLHDLGKYDHRFQGKLPVLFERLNGVPISVQGSFDHGGGGLHFYSRFRVETGKITPNKVDWFDFIRATTSHHGRYTQFKKYRAMGKIQDSCLNADLREVFGPERDRAISEHIRRAETLFPLPDFEPFKEAMADAMVFLAGLCSVSDWLGSDSRFFPCGPLSRPFTRETFQADADEAARRLLAANHLLGKYCGKPEAILSRVFPDRNRVVLRPLQETALNMPLSKTPQLVVIEAPMGEGKTEAALMIADRLLAAGSAEKLYFALPTMATANAMYGRMSDIMAEHRFFDEGSSLVLAHGKRNLRQGFRKHILVPHQKENYQDSENPPAQMMCSRFFAQSHKRSLLANVGVGTVDQIMSAVLGGRHHWVKLFGLADSVVIIDEVHAYDAYMRKILGRLIEWLKALGTHVVLLSATLPRVIRRTLAAELDSVAEENDSGEYPLITHLSNGRPPKFIPCKASASAKKTLFFQMTREPDDIIDRLLANARAGAQCCVVLNTVAKAQELFKILRDSEKVDGIELMLFHSRFMLKDRSDMEEAVLSRFGKSGDRSSGRILIATQVVEQSLDVDFDFMVSEIAPIDLLLQRAGRLHRFPWNKTHRRATLWESPRMMVFMPCQGVSKLLDDRKENPDARSVYDAAILYRTALLFQNDDAELKVKIPDDIRILVDRVYDREGIDIPSDDSDRHAQSWREWEDMEFAQKTRGAGVLQPAPNGKSCDLGNQTAPGSDPDDVMESQEMTESLQSGRTRLTHPSQTIVFVNDSWLVRRENFAQDPEAYIRFLEKVELHSVTVLQDMIRGVDSNSYRLDPNVMTPDEWKNTVRQFEKELPAWKGYVLLPLVEGNDDARYEFSAPVVLAYSPSMGLQLEYPSREKRPFFRLRESSVEDPTTDPFDDPANEIRVEKGAGKSPRFSKPPSPEEDLKRKVRSNPLKDRISYLHVGRARLDVDDSGLVMTSNEGEAFRQIPVASLTVILLEPGSTVTHEAVKLCALHKCLLIWVGEGGVRLYSAGYSDFSSSEKLLHQAGMYHDPAQRLTVVRRMFEIRFQRPCPMNKSVDQLRGMEGQRVKKRYKELAEKYGIPWDGRLYDPAKWQKADTINRVISTATSCMYGIVEAAILTAGYSPAIGFLHSGKPLSFVYDIADLYKDAIALPLCFELVKEHQEVAESMVRHRLRDVFRKERFLETLIPSIEKILEPVER